MNCTWNILSVLRIYAVFVLVLHGEAQYLRECLDPCLMSANYHHIITWMFSILHLSITIRSDHQMTFMPRAVVKKLFKEGELQNMEDIKTFANQYVVKAEIVNDYIKHLKNIELTKQLRATVTKNEANTRKTKKYEDYNWSAMIKDGSIGKLTVIELNKFLQANKLPQQVNKPDKINHLQVTELSIPLGDDTDEDVILAATITDNEEAEAEANLRSKSGRLRRPTHTFNSDFVFY